MIKEITDKHLIHLFYPLLYIKKINKNRLEADILDYTKKNRRGLSKEEIIDLGYNIYPKSGITAKELISYAVENEYILENLNEYSLTIKGYKKYIEILTDNFSDDYFDYKMELEEEINKKRFPIPSELTIANLYSIKKNPKVYAKELSENKMIIATGKYIKELLNRNDINFEDKFTLNLRPTLYVPNQFIGAKVKLEIKGLDIPNNINISSPYPNKKYFVAGQNFKDLKTNCGFFYEFDFDNIKSKKITLIWTIKSDINTIIVEHNLFLNFIHTKDYGSMFSTNQNFNYNTNYPKFKLVTNIDNLDTDFWGERVSNIKYNKNKIIIDEYAELINFPIKLQGGLYDEEGFNKIYNNLYK